ncbi:hypothetical protein MBLNU459_g0033t1 [Dothideomycetes sp. NU459]
MFIKAVLFSSLAALAIAGDASCSAEPAGAGPAISPDTADAFSASTELSDLATNAATPDCYLQAFSNKQGLPQGSYLLNTYTLDAYDPEACKQYCTDTTFCSGINIFFERWPTVMPAVGCANPASTTNIKCALYATTITVFGAKDNFEQELGPLDESGESFKVVVAGSNAYNYNC